MSPTRTRARRAKPEADTAQTEADFSPMDVAAVAEVPGAEDDEQRYGQTVDEYPEDGDGDLPADHDDGSGSGNQVDHDPSATNQLGNTTAGFTQGQQAAKAELNDYIRRLTNLHEERAAIGEDIKELNKEIKGKGYDMKAVALVLKLKGYSEGKIRDMLDQKKINETYAEAVGVNTDLV